MPKEQYIIYNKYLNNFIFYEGEKQHNRLEFKLENQSPLEVFRKIKDKIDKKRKTDLFVEGFDRNFVNYLRKEYKETKINIIEK